MLKGCWKNFIKVRAIIALGRCFTNGFVRSVPWYLARKNITQKSLRYQVRRTKFKTEQNYATLRQVFMHLNARHQSWGWPVRLLLVMLQLTVAPDSYCRFWKSEMHLSIFGCTDLYQKSSVNVQHTQVKFNKEKKLKSIGILNQCNELFKYECLFMIFLCDFRLDCTQN